jgi:hypothetical protein
MRNCLPSEFPIINAHVKALNVQFRRKEVSHPADEEPDIRLLGWRELKQGRYMPSGNHQSMPLSHGISIMNSEHFLV